MAISPRTLAALRARSRGVCEAGLPGCQRAPVQAHHRKYRSRGGSDALVNLDDLCAPCHEAVHRHRPGTARFRTPSWAPEGTTEADHE